MAENVGHVIQIAGPAVDLQFSDGHLPPIYEAVKVVSDGFVVPEPINVILEVQQHLGEDACAPSPCRPLTAWCAHEGH